MVDTNPFVDAASGLFGGILTGSLWVFVGIIIAGSIIGVAIYYRYRKKFDIVVEITSERAGDDNAIFYDKAAILKEKGGKTKYLRLLSTKIDLPVPPFNILEKTNKGDLLRLWRKSEDEFTYMTTPEISRDVVIRQDGKAYNVAQKEYKQLEGDIAYWNIKRKEAHMGLFNKENILMKLLPFIPHIIAGVMIVFILYVLLDGLPELISVMSELASEMNKLLQQMQTLQAATSTSV